MSAEPQQPPTPDPSEPPEPSEPEPRATRDGSDPPAPEGAVCAEHPERAAYFTCPRCGGYACVFCWHPAVKRCHGCITRDPTEAAPPLPWERDPDDAGGLLARYVGTLGTAFRPTRTAPAFARPGIAPALRFMLLSALPLALLAGIIPHTRTLLFHGYFQIEVLGQPSLLDIVLDIARAAAVQLAATAVELACLYLPYTSLVRAYAPEKRHAAARVVLYRLWLLPGAMVLMFLLSWALLPKEAAEQGASDMIVAVILLLRVVPPVLLILAMLRAARLACGLSRPMSLLVVAVPVVLLMVVEPMAGLALDALLPDVPEPAAAP